jgi:hypothetical protein
MRLRLPTLLTALLAVGVIATGCGDDDEETTAGATGATGATGAGGPAPTKDEFIAEADRLCQRAEDELDQEFEGGAPISPPDLARDVIVPMQQELIDDLRALTPPADDESQIEAILNRLQTGVDQLEDDPALFERSLDSPKVLEDVYADARQRASEYGFAVCGQG